MRFYFTLTSGNYHTGSSNIDIELGKGEFASMNFTKLFQFAYLTPSSRSRLKRLEKGVVLKQKFAAPENRFNINVTQRYKPYVRNTVSVSCPRRGNNCVWPNPLPKYSVRISP